MNANQSMPAKQGEIGQAGKNKSVMRLSTVQLLPVLMYQKCIGTETHYESRAGSPIEIAERWEEKPKQTKSQFEEK